MIHNEIVTWALSRGWRQDERGNLIKEHEGTEFRLRFRKKKLLHEVHVLQDVGFAEPKMAYRWNKIASAYYKDLSLSDDRNKLMGMKRKI